MRSYSVISRHGSKSSPSLDRSTVSWFLKQTTKKSVNIFIFLSFTMEYWSWQCFTQWWDMLTHLYTPSSFYVQRRIHVWEWHGLLPSPPISVSNCILHLAPKWDVFASKLIFFLNAKITSYWILGTSAQNHSYVAVCGWTGGNVFSTFVKTDK